MINQKSIVPAAHKRDYAPKNEELPHESIMTLNAKQPESSNDPSVIHAKELLRQRNVFWVITSLSTFALLIGIYLIRVLII